MTVNDGSVVTAYADENGEVFYEIDISNLTSDQALFFAVESSSGKQAQFLYSASKTGPFADWDINNPVGKYFVQAFIPGDNNYYDVSDVASFMVNNDTFVVETEATKGLVYNNLEQVLGKITASVSNPTLQYQVDDGRWCDEPKAIHAGKHTVNFVASKPNYDDVIGSFEAEIAQKPLTESMLSLKNEYTYSGHEISVEYSVSDPQAYIASEDYFVTGDKAINAGDYQLHICANSAGNYFGEIEKDWIINKAVPELILSPTASYDINCITEVDTNYNGDGKLSAVSSEPSIAEVSVSGTKLIVKTKEQEGSTTISLYASEGDNYLATEKHQNADAVNMHATVTFDSMGGTHIDSQTILKGDKVQKPVDPTYAGHSFAGWYLDNQHTKVFDFNTPIYSDITLYAKWKTGELIFPDNIPGITVDKIALMKVLDKVIEENPTADAITLIMGIKKGDVIQSDIDVLANALPNHEFELNTFSLHTIIDGKEQDYGDTNQIIVPVTYDIANYETSIKSVRVHNGQFTEFASTPNQFGEYAIHDSSNSKITICASKYSTYGFAKEIHENNVVATNDSDAKFNTASTNDNFWWCISIASLFVIGLVVTISKTKRRV